MVMQLGITKVRTTNTQMEAVDSSMEVCQSILAATGQNYSKKPTALPDQSGSGMCSIFSSE